MTQKPFMPPTHIERRRNAVASLIRTATAHVLAAERRDKPKEDPARLAEKLWPNDRDVGMLIRGAVSTTTTTSAAAVLTTLTEYLIASLSPAYAGATLLAQTLQLSFDGAATISVPGFVADASGASFVREGAPIPARSLMAKPLLLDPSKLATISALTNEVINGSAGNAQKLVEDVLMRSVGLALDAALFDANPAIAETRPAGLRWNIAAETASGATDPTEAMLADIGALLGIVSAVAGNTPLVLVAAPARAIMLKLRSPRELPVTVLASSAVADADLIAIAPVGIVSASDSAPEISVSRETVLHMDDAPTNIGEAAGVAAPSISMFQTDVLALRCRMEATWARRHDAAVAWLSAGGW
ncbi:phage major capsid protein [Bradyrhizobium sp. RT4b]|uniref:phage major capsid protein n=1 Tax=Bradyrhizobium sp. RT4b TaxID=3156379 RepID=UPI003399D8AD